jgi:hypothetical protein
MMAALRSAETSVYFYESTWRNIPEGSHMKIALDFILDQK